MTQQAHPSGSVFAQLLAQALSDHVGSVDGQTFLDLSLDRGQTAEHLRRGGAVGWTGRGPRQTLGGPQGSPDLVSVGDRLPLADHTLDLVSATLYCSRHHDLGALAVEASRVLRPGGRWLVAEHHPYSQLDEAAESGRHQHLASDYVEALRQAGLTLRRLDEPRWRHRPFLWVLLAERVDLPAAGMPRSVDVGSADSTPGSSDLAAGPADLQGPMGTLPPVITEARRAPFWESWTDRALESLWSTVFRLSKRRHGPGRSEWSPRGGQRILVLSARPGDEVIGCAGALMAHREAGDLVTVAQLSDGRRSARSEIGRRADGGRHALNPRQRAALRHREAREASHLIGFDLNWSGIDDREIDAIDLRPVLQGLLNKYRPDILYTPSRCSRDPMAQRLAAGLAQTLERQSSPGPAEIRIYGLDVPLTPVLANLILPMPPKDMARAAMHTYLSHLGPTHPCWRHRRYSGHLWKRRFPVEEAWQVTGAEFQLLHDRLVVGSGSALHPLRRRPWTDPWAYFGGHSERTGWVRRLLVPR